MLKQYNKYALYVQEERGWKYMKVPHGTYTDEKCNISNEYYAR